MTDKDAERIIAGGFPIIAATAYQAEGNHLGAARVLLKNLGGARRQRSLWLFLAATQLWKAGWTKEAKRISGLVDTNTLDNHAKRSWADFRQRLKLDLRAEQEARTKQLKAQSMQRDKPLPPLLAVRPKGA